MQQDLQRLFILLSYLNFLPLEYLTDSAANAIIPPLEQVRPHLDQIDRFTIEQANAPQTRDSLVQRIHSSVDNIYNMASPWIPFLAYQKGDIAQNLEKLTASVAEANGIIEKAKSDIANRA